METSRAPGPRAGLRLSFASPVFVLAIVLLAALSAPLNAGILLNEVHFRTPASTNSIAADGNFEFVELKSTTGGVEPCTDLWILVIENGGSGVGEIKQAWQLRNADGSWMATGTNGLLLLGDDYTRPDSPWRFIKTPRTAMGDPDGMGPDSISNVRALSFLLVSGYVNPAPLAGTTRPDIDMDNDGAGVFDWLDPTPPAIRYSTPLWNTIVDSAGFNGEQAAVIQVAYAFANLSESTIVAGVPRVDNTASFYPHTMARSGTDNNANSRAAWYGGTVSGIAADALTYGGSHFNLIPGAIWKGLVTPGQSNLSTAPIAPEFRINEINLNPPGTPGNSPDPASPQNQVANDGKFEYVEIVNNVANQLGGSNYSGSLTNYALLLVRSGGTAANVGKIRQAWSLNKFATGPNGLLVLGDDYPGGYSPFTNLFDPATQLADPDETAGATPGTFTFSKMNAGDISNNGVTFLLVQNFTGLVGQDIDADNDGVLNTVDLPFSSIIDSVAVPEVLNDALVAGRGGYSAAQPDILVSGKHYNADNLSRILGNNGASSTAAWSAGVFGSNDPYGLPYRNGYNLTGSGTAFRGAASPGKANYNAAAPPVAGTFLLNEVHIDPPTGADESEFIEVIGAPHALMTNLWLVVIDATPVGSGTVQRVFDLRGQSTGSNGLALFADGVEEGTNTLLESTSLRTAADDPDSFNADGTPNTPPFNSGFNFAPNSVGPNAGVSVLLVTYTAGTPTGVPATPGADLDANNDGVLDATPPWTLVDGISTGNGIGGVPVLSTPGGPPGSVCRYAKNTAAVSAGAWFGGVLTGGTSTSFNYSTNFFGAFKGAASPGRHNVTATPGSTAGLLLNEININPPGGDNNKEFVELRSTDNSAMSTNNYSILLVDNDGSETGRVLKVWDLDSGATGSNGLLLAGHNYESMIPWTDAGAVPDAATRMFSPDGMELNDIGLNTDNGALTMLLVKDFKGRAGDDLDEGTQANRLLNDDHIFNMPVLWESQSDSVAMKGFAAPDGVNPTYRLEGFIFPPIPVASYPGTADLTVPIPAIAANGYTPDTVGRFGGNNTSNNASAWYGGNIPGTAATSTVYSSTQYFPATLSGGKVTPGQPNILALTDDSDTDNDGVNYLMETALGMNPFTPDNYKLPGLSMQTIGLVLQPAFIFTLPSGGAADINYTVQASFNLQSWSVPTVLESTAPNSPAPGYDTRIFVLNPAVLALLDVNKRVYFRLAVSRQ